MRAGRRRRLGGVIAAALVLAGAIGWAGYLRDIAALRADLAAGARAVALPGGAMDYAVAGDGPPVLVIHGAGGGRDQGLLIARAYGGEGFRWIAPSRFGYLGSTLPADASTAAQADALAALLDHLGLGRVAVLAMSGGAPPALQLASRHPGRVAALVLVSAAPYAPLTAEAQELPVPAWLYRALFGSDLPYWLAARLMPSALHGLFDVPRGGARAPEDAAFVAAMIRAFLPVTLRAAGLANEGAAIDPAHPVDLAGIAAPVLILHARDDRLAPFETAAFTAAQLPQAELVPFETGGHLVLGHLAEIRARVGGFLLRHSGD